MTTAAKSEYAIDVRDLNKSFGDKHVVNNVSLRVRKGEIFGFLGPNGSGKTTTIRLMCGLLKPDSGSGTCLGYDILRQSGNIKRDVGYMTQRFSFWDDLTIAENLDFVARMYDVPNRQMVVRRTASFAQNSGADTYKSKCQMCHADDGSGSTPAGKSTKAHPFNSLQVIKMSDNDLINVTTNGHGKMPAYKGKLTDDQIKDVVAYIHTLQNFRVKPA